MEDILTVILFFVVASITGLFIRNMLKTNAARIAEQEKNYEAERARIKAIAQERTLARMASINTPPPKQREFVKRDESFGVARGSQLNVTHTQSQTQSVSSYQDNFLSDVVTAVAINSLLSNTHKSAGSDYPKEERSVGVSKSESSWGFDDSDSRKSISSSMDTSSSWSSSSSSDSSGPSSDW